MGETHTLAEFAANATFEDVPDEIVAEAKRAIRDYVGVALYGSQHGVGERISTYVDRCMTGEEAAVLGRGAASPPGAALANGAFGHAIDYDDTFESIVIHPTSPVFPAALAGVQVADGTGRDALTAYVVGVEAAFRTGHATYPSHYDNGWHSTGTVGTFGATAAAASALGLNAEEIAHAYGIAASSSSSLKKNFGTMTKPLHAGHAAQMGVRAALLAESGFTADDAVFEGDIGYGEVMTPGGEYDPTQMTEGLGEEWAVADIGFKPYPSGVITHAAMDALRAVVEREDLDPADVETVRVALDEAASEMLIHADPDDALQAKFSIEFCLAAILREGDAGVREFSDEYVADPRTREVMAKVERDFETNLFGGSFAGYGARVTVTTKDGEEYVEVEKHAPGSPNNPVSDERLDAKFFECAEPTVGPERADAVAAAVADLDAEGALDRLLENATAENEDE
ncbi:MmgE/PrpD family protein [Halorussus sp. MSC15.2]|uniref:MmgE/PrpD family protein n=1 Tax=Halorussus sp. MSC15.2 TaxID=2283638 RepID=UPI0013D55DA9|nr:MmgE/PrpD family protein [Halorussus sp. MSC15.2]NEU58673.1 MmgE/PrpD family protein [Halorussus sp. MSC15.2]